MTYTGLQNDINRPPVVGNILAKPRNRRDQGKRWGVLVGNILAKPRNRRDQGKRWGVLVGILQSVHDYDMTTVLVGSSHISRLIGVTPAAVGSAYLRGRIDRPGDQPNFEYYPRLRAPSPLWTLEQADRIAAGYLERGGW